jgi:D-alanine-D-alanine ligase-like ATP-grasp enzyme
VRPPPLISQLLCRLAERAGVEVELEPNFGRAGVIRLGEGRYSYFLNGALDLNPVGASDIAIAKDWCAHFMQRLGYPVVEGEPFYSPRFCESLESDRNIDAAWAYAQRLGLPVIVKPNSRSQGRGVCKAHNRREFMRAAKAVFRRDRVMLVQRFVAGHDFRIVVLDGEVISAYERLPLTVTGDGVSTIRELVEAKQRRFVAIGRDTEIDLEDMRIPMHLARRKLTLDSVMRDGAQQTLLDNANLSTGGDALDVTDVIHEDFRRLSADVTRDMGLRFCGVDIMVDGDVTQAAAPGRHWILEINAAPGLDHYVAIGTRQEAIVDALYLKVMEALKVRVPADAGRQPRPA